MTDAPLLAVLLVEDDPISRAFLAEALAGLSIRVIACGSCAEAVHHASAQPFALWLLDAHLPDGDGLACLAALRALAPTIPALAITASEDRAELAALAAGGFDEVLQKPLAAAALHASVRRALSLPMRAPPAMPPGKAPLWDEAQALRAVGGRTETLAALRGLFRDELPAQLREIRAAVARRDADGVAAIAHRLVASCGFVGAARLRDASRALLATPLDAGALAWFEATATDVLATPA